MIKKTNPKNVFQTTREIFEHNIWKEIQKFRLFFLIYGNAVFADDIVKYGNIKINRGSWLRSYRNIQKDLEYLHNNSIKSPSISCIKRMIDDLVEEKRIKIQSTKLGTLFSVLNYDDYQYNSLYGLEHPKNRRKTDIEQPENNNKKDKNGKKDKNIYMSLWNDLSKTTSLKTKLKLNKSIIDHIKNREKENDDFMNDFRSALEKIEFNTELQTKSWLNFEFMFIVKNSQCGIDKINDGKYDFLSENNNKPEKKKRTFTLSEVPEPRVERIKREKEERERRENDKRSI